MRGVTEPSASDVSERVSGTKPRMFVIPVGVVTPTVVPQTALRQAVASGGEANARRAAIDVETPGADKAEQRHVGIPRQFGCEARRRANGGENRDAGGHGLLYQLVTGAPADENQVLGQRHRTREHPGADEFVEGVVAADVFADVQQATLLIEEGGRVQTAGAVEDRLRPAQRIGQGMNDRSRYRVAVGHRRLLDSCQGFERLLAAQTAGRGREETARQLLRIHADGGRQLDADDIAQESWPDTWSAVRGALDIRTLAHDPLGEEEPDRQFDVGTGCAHGHGQTLTVASSRRAESETNLERLLRCQ